jgi:hypothetical protein
MSLNIERVGEPRLLPGSSAYASPSVQVQNEYEIDTTPLLGWPTGVNWQRYFNSQLRGDPFRAEHDGVNKITASCFPGDEPQLIEEVDAAIEKTNEHEGTIPYAH